MYYDLSGWSGHQGMASVNLNECLGYGQIGNRIRFKFRDGDFEDVLFEDEEVVRYVLNDLRKYIRYNCNGDKT